MNNPDADTSPEGWRRYFDYIMFTIQVLPHVKNHADAMAVFFSILHANFKKEHMTRLFGTCRPPYANMLIVNAKRALKPIPDRYKSNYDKVINELKATHKWAEERSLKAAETRQWEVFFSSIRPVHLHSKGDFNLDDFTMIGYLASKDDTAEHSWVRPSSTDFTSNYGYTKKRNIPDYLFSADMDTPALLDYFSQKLMLCMKDSYCNEREKLVMQELLSGYKLLKNRHASCMVFTAAQLNNIHKFK